MATNEKAGTEVPPTSNAGVGNAFNNETKDTSVRQCLKRRLESKRDKESVVLSQELGEVDRGRSWRGRDKKRRRLQPTEPLLLL